MSEQKNIPITALLSLAIPICSILGFCYAMGYFQELGCRWAIPALTIQQLIMNSSIASFSFAFPFILTVGLVISGTEYTKIITSLSILAPIILALLLIGWLFGKVESSLIIIAISVSFLCLYASYLAETLVAINSNRKTILKHPVGISLTGLLLIIVTSTHIGQAYAQFQLNHKDHFFPIITDGAYGKEQRLISAIGASFLIANMNNGEIGSFKLISKPQSYTVFKPKD